MENNSTTCNWSVRPGTNNSFFVFTPCKPGFNYLSKVKNIDNIKSIYDNTICPICEKTVKITIID